MLFSSLIAISLFSIAAQSAEVDGSKVCLGEFAICSGAYCEPISGTSKYVECKCQGPLTGLNVGNSSCESRSKKLTSTFSLENQLPSFPNGLKHSITCIEENESTWANCVDAPCTRKDGAMTCKCPVVAKSENGFFGEDCPSDAAGLSALCAKMRSAAPLTNSSSSPSNILQSFYGKPPATLPLCMYGNSTEEA